MFTQRLIALAIAIGILGAFLVFAWWHSELTAIMGDVGAQRSFHCLVIAGTEDCSSSLTGLHEKNLIASFLYYNFIGLVICGFSKAEAKK